MKMHLLSRSIVLNLLPLFVLSTKNTETTVLNCDTDINKNKSLKGGERETRFKSTTSTVIPSGKKRETLSVWSKGTYECNDNEWIEEDDDDDDDSEKDTQGGPSFLPPETATAKLELSGMGRRSEAQREELRSCIHWAVGLEHESMLVHRHNNGLEEFAIDANKILREMARYGPIHGLTAEEHAIAVKANDDGAEFSGRRCAGSIDLVYKTMMESVSVDALENTFDGVWDQVYKMDEAFVRMANMHPFLNRAIEDNGFGNVSRPLTGMSNQLGMYQRTAGHWFSCASCGTCRLKDYTGSYHMSISLPSTTEGWVARDETILSSRDKCAPPNNLKATKSHSDAHRSISDIFWLPSIFHSAEEEKRIQQEEWIEAHMNLGNMIQWIEPLLVSVFGSADADSVCDAGLYTEGSFRTMRTGWGVPGTTDVRTFKKQGITRYIENNFEWMFPNVTELLPSAYRDDLSGCIKEGMGADIRTKSTINDSHLKPGESPPPMEIGRGIELRFFDNFPIEHMPQVYRMIVLVAEAGRDFTASEYIYNNTDWIGAIQSVMREGWNAILPEEYVLSMSAALNLSPSFAEKVGRNFQAFHVYSLLYQNLWETHFDGMWTSLLLDDIPKDMPILENPNRDSWEIGAITMGITPKKILEKLGLDETTLPRRVIIDDDVNLLEADCGEDLDDLVYLAERFGMVSNVTKKTDGTIEWFNLKPSDKWNSVYSRPRTCSSTRI